MARADQIHDWSATLEGRDAAGILSWAAESFAGRVALASSLGLEDQLLTDLIARDGLPIPVFTIVTGRLFQESHELVDRTRARYGITVRVLFPEAAEVEPMVAEYGTELFRTSVELRKHCCAIGPE